MVDVKYYHPVEISVSSITFLIKLELIKTEWMEKYTNLAHCISMGLLSKISLKICNQMKVLFSEPDFLSIFA